MNEDQNKIDKLFAPLLGSKLEQKDVQVHSFKLPLLPIHIILDKEHKRLSERLRDLYIRTKSLAILHTKMLSLQEKFGVRR